MAAEISSREPFETWLEGKSREVQLILALRASLRVLPLAVDPAQWQGRDTDPKFAIWVFRSLVVTTAFAMNPAGEEVRRAFHNVFGAYTTVPALEAAKEAFLSAHAATSGSAPLAAQSAAYAAYAASTASASAFADVWKSISNDCMQLDGGVSPAALLTSPLWRDYPEWCKQVWERSAELLSRPEHGFAIWRDWYIARLAGLPHAWERFDAAVDQVFHLWIVARADGWWNRPPAAVNADINAKVEELSRPALPTDHELVQNPLAINFQPTENGQVALGTTRDPAKLDTSESARARHAEVLAEANKALEESRLDRTQATDLERPWRLTYSL